MELLEGKALPGLVALSEKPTIIEKEESKGSKKSGNMVENLKSYLSDNVVVAAGGAIVLLAIARSLVTK